MLANTRKRRRESRSWRSVRSHTKVMAMKASTKAPSAAAAV